MKYFLADHPNILIPNIIIIDHKLRTPTFYEKISTTFGHILISFTSLILSEQQLALM